MDIYTHTSNKCILIKYAKNEAPHFFLIQMVKQCVLPFATLDCSFQISPFSTSQVNNSFANNIKYFSEILHLAYQRFNTAIIVGNNSKIPNPLFVSSVCYFHSTANRFRLLHAICAGFHSNHSLRSLNVHILHFESYFPGKITPSTSHLVS